MPEDAARGDPVTRLYRNRLERTQKALAELDGPNAAQSKAERPSMLRPRQTGGELKRVTREDVEALRSAK
jgi:hypothetical protein